MPHCIAFVPSRANSRVWSRCKRSAAAGDRFCRQHRDALIGILLAEHFANLARHAKQQRKIAREFVEDWTMPLPTVRAELFISPKIRARPRTIEPSPRVPDTSSGEFVVAESASADGAIDGESTGNQRVVGPSAMRADPDKAGR